MITRRKNGKAKTGGRFSCLVIKAGLSENVTYYSRIRCSGVHKADEPDNISAFADLAGRELLALSKKQEMSLFCQTSMMQISAEL